MNRCILAACAAILAPALGVAQQGVPKVIAVPAGYKLSAKLTAKGVQVYKAVEAKGGGLQWEFEGPIAELTDAKGAKAGYHFDGPSWEAADGSKVLRDASEAVKSAPAPNAKNDVPWLLIKVKAADGAPGNFAKVTYIQRVATSGGKAPADPPKRAGTRIGVPYTAEYHLWVKAD
jgi:hypothetical protein